jgi:DNA-binding transcriptional MerR regulator
VITRRTLVRRLGVDRATLDRLESLQLLVPVRRPGREPAYDLGELDHLRVWLVLVRELEVNPPGAEIILRLRQQLLETRRRLTLFFEEARAAGLLEELRGILEGLEGDDPLG